MSNRMFPALPGNHLGQGGKLAMHNGRLAVFRIRQSSVSAYALPPPFKKEALGSGSSQRFFVYGHRAKALKPKGSFGKGAATA